VNFKIIPILFTLALISISGVPLQYAFANDTSGELFYTRFSGASRVEKVNFDFTAGVFTLETPISVSGNHGADGIAFNPNNPSQIIVANQGTDVLRIDRNHLGANNGGIIQTANVGVSSFHLEIADSSTLYVSAIPGTPARVALNGDGTIGASQALSDAGNSDDLAVTQIITTPLDGFFYTSGGPGGNGNFGTITFPGATTFETTILFAHEATHGGEYDPFTGDIMIFGDSFMAQIDPSSGTLVSFRDFDGVCSSTDPANNTPVPVFPNFDQGTVDGNGHAFVADNGGHLFFVDYSATSDIANLGNFVACPFLAIQLDDIAPILDSMQMQMIGGEIMPINSVSLLVAGVQSNAFSLLGALALVGGVAFGAFYLSSKRKN